MRTKVDKPSQIDWIEPTYLNLEWYNNDLPTPAKEITRDEFDLLRDHNGYSLEGINFHSHVYLPDTEEKDRRAFKGWTVHYYFWHHQALALASKYLTSGEWEDGKVKVGLGDFLPERKSSYSQYTWGYARRYYRLGCTHSWKELTQQECRERDITHFGNCWHVTECTECGKVWSYDSSG